MKSFLKNKRINNNKLAENLDKVLQSTSNNLAEKGRIRKILMVEIMVDNRRFFKVDFLFDNNWVKLKTLLSENEIIAKIQKFTMNPNVIDQFLKKIGRMQHNSLKN